MSRKLSGDKNCKKAWDREKKAITFITFLSLWLKEKRTKEETKIYSKVNQ